MRARGIGGVDAVHVVPLFVGDHLERQFVVVAQEQGPLGALRDGRRLLHDVDDGQPILHPDGHEHPRHDREVERHVAFVAGAEVSRRILGPLVRLGQQHAVAVALVHMAAQIAQEGMRLGQVLAVRPVPLEQVRNRVEPESVHAAVQPEVHGPGDRRSDPRIVEVEVRLVGVEAVPVVGAGDRIPGPVGGLEVLEDDPRIRIAIRRVAPDVEVAPWAAGGGPAGPLEPRMLVRGVVADQLCDDPQAAVGGPRG